MRGLLPKDRSMTYATPLALAFALLSAPAAWAACSVTIDTARCVTVPIEGQAAPSDRDGTSARFVAAPERIVPDRRGQYLSASAGPLPAPTYRTGDILPDEVTILMNRERHGLPEPRDGWTYFRTGREVYRADMQTRVVIDRVNDHMQIRF